jgi:hypothetical protein
MPCPERQAPLLKSRLRGKLMHTVPSLPQLNTLVEALTTLLQECRLKEAPTPTSTHWAEWMDSTTHRLKLNYLKSTWTLPCAGTSCKLSRWRDLSLTVKAWAPETQLTRASSWLLEMAVCRLIFALTIKFWSLLNKIQLIPTSLLCLSTREGSLSWPWPS